MSQKKMGMRVGVLTGGGDCPGLNASIRAVVREAEDNFKDRVIGIGRGWKGLVDPDPRGSDIEDLNRDKVAKILDRGGTILGSSRTNPFKIECGSERIKTNFARLELDALIAIGGEDTLGVAARLYEKLGLPIVGIPKTIDKDLRGTDFSIGFDTAVEVAKDAIDRLRTTSESHDRVMVVEVMGRNTGWIAVYAGITGGADVVLIPEVPVNFNKVCEVIQDRYKRGRTYSIVVVAEGVSLDKDLVVKDSEHDSFGHEKLGGVGDLLAGLIRQRIKVDTRSTNLGHIQRGGSPTATDRILATRLGIKAVNMVHKNQFGYMSAIRGSKIVRVSLQEVIKGLKKVDMEMYEIANKFY